MAGDLLRIYTAGAVKNGGLAGFDSKTIHSLRVPGNAPNLRLLHRRMGQNGGFHAVHEVGAGGHKPVSFISSQPPICEFVDVPQSSALSVQQGEGFSWRRSDETNMP
uniref:Uncharacterized protein n=1 Tax=Ananas comosus var. bracteatus TaxID=296719 RepID=A0A6V7NHC3_ANACO|nr:unnamed protein product [Ananas comosus var. bracteatus]